MKLVHFAAVTAVLAATSMVSAAPELVFFAPHGGPPVKWSSMPHATAEQFAEAQAANPTRDAGLFNTPVYLDVVNNTNVGFDDPTLGAARRATLEAVLDYIEGILDYPANRCDVEVQPSINNSGSPVLAFAGTSYFATNGFQPGLAASRIQTGSDVNGSDAEIAVTVNYGHPWNSETDAPTGSEFDMFTVLLHEITHGLGIASLTTSSGASQFDTSPFFVDAYTEWDNHLFEVSPNTKVWNASTFAFQATSLVEGNGSIAFQGTATNSSFGSNPPIYTPVGFQSGSSVSHWQLVAPIPGNAVMRPSVAPGVTNRTYQPFEIATLQDIGYAINADVKDWSMY